MRILFFLLMMLPVVSFGQKEQDEQKAMLEKKSDGVLTLVSAGKTTKKPAVKKNDDRKKLKEDIVYTGNVKFTIGENVITCDSAISYENEGTIGAYRVTVTHPSSFTIKGDAMEYNREQASAVLTSNITITALNGMMIGTSERFAFDFNYQRYRISSGSITPPKESEQH